MIVIKDRKAHAQFVLSNLRPFTLQRQTITRHLSIENISWISLQCKLYNLTTVWLQVHRMDRKLDQTLVLLNTLTKSLVVAKPRTKSVTGKQDGNTSDKYCDSDDMMDASEKASLSPNV